MALSRNAELWGCALAIEREHGPAAFLHTSMAIDRLNAEGEQDAAGVWREVLKRLELLEAKSNRSQ